MRCKHSERTAGERAERLGRDEGDVMYELQRILNCDSKPIGARGKATKGRRQAKALGNHVHHRANRP